MNEFIILIISYGRADNLKTLKTLEKYGYKGDYRIVCSDDDKTLDLYKKNFGDKVVVFNKEKIKEKFDIGDNIDDYRVAVFARNALWDIAKDLGYKYFIELDDDYSSFNYRVNSEGRYQTKKTKIKDINWMFEVLFKFFKKIDAKTLCIAQAGDFIGGESCSVFKKGLARKAMNFFICKTDNPFNFLGRINEDVTTYVNLGNKGDLFFTVCELSLTQELTQTNEGGFTDVYKNEGTYVKSFYSVMYNPSSVKVGLMGAKNMRLHHKINWNKSVPKILDEKYKK
tara:strand:+ start:3204 stop:4052 length:849 start_codon:yes stop_codon:yes gene_type:complete